MLKISPDQGQAAGLASPTSLVVTRRVTFAAAHVLRRPDWDERRNQDVFGQCAGDHGHNYVLEVSVGGEPDPETGMIIDLKDLDQTVRETIVRHVDHRHLNRDVPFLKGVIPTAENLALAFWQQLEGRLSSGRLQHLRLVESENNSVDVTR
jgi:6-pyruvoyltetrahydropterin/6-carboxytetrahydropterin synthase